MGYRIRKAHTTDIFIIKQILNAAHRQNTRIGFIFPASQMTISKLLIKMRSYKYYVLVINKKVAGTVAVKKSNGNSEIGSLAILPKFQKRGFGKKMLRFAEKKLLSLGVNKVALTTPRKHPFLPKYYQKQGYVPMKQVRKHSKWMRLQKNLRSIQVNQKLHGFT